MEQGVRSLRMDGVRGEVKVRVRSNSAPSNDEPAFRGGGLTQMEEDFMA